MSTAKENLLAAIGWLITFTGAYYTAKNTEAEPHSSKDGKLLLGTLIMAFGGYASIRADAMDEDE